MGKKKLSRTDILRICIEIGKLVDDADAKLVHNHMDRKLTDVVDNSIEAYNDIKVVQTKIKEIVDSI